MEKTEEGKIAIARFDNFWQIGNSSDFSMGKSVWKTLWKMCITFCSVKLFIKLCKYVRNGWNKKTDEIKKRFLSDFAENRELCRKVKILLDGNFGDFEEEGELLRSWFCKRQCRNTDSYRWEHKNYFWRHLRNRTWRKIEDMIYYSCCVAINFINASVAQPVEQLIRNQQVADCP